jgi:hypothetical protein
VQTVVGEFYWQVRRRDVAKTTDFISPPFILSCEESKDETVWSHGVYLTGAELQAGLNTTKTPPTPKGVAPHQPNPWRNTRALSLAVFFPACLLSLIVHFLCSPSVTEKVLEQSFLYTPLAPAVEVTSKNFTVSKEKTTLALDLSAPVDNSWLAFDIDLLNLSQNSSVSQAAELAYYHGYDDGYWSEGSTTERYYFTNISPGSYALTIAATGDQKRANSLTYTATVTQGAFPRQNLFLALFALALGPICAVFGYYRFEGRRWGQSSTVDGKEDGSEALTNEE